MRHPIQAAMVLSAGYGLRMRPLTETIPKPLVQLAGRALIDHVLDRLDTAGIQRVVVNVHYLADVLEGHLKLRVRPDVQISDERDAVLDTGGGVKKALPLLGDMPFVVHNSDSVWVEGTTNNLDALFAFWDDRKMDCLLLLSPVIDSLGYDGTGDFNMNKNGQLMRRKTGGTAHYVFAGVSIMKPQLFAGTPEGPFSLNVIWDQAIERSRLFGFGLDGQWMHIGTVDALHEAERRLANAAHA